MRRIGGCETVREVEPETRRPRSWWLHWVINIAFILVLQLPFVLLGFNIVGLNLASAILFSVVSGLILIPVSRRWECHVLAAIGALAVISLVGTAMWPAECLSHPSMPPQGPFCTTFFGLPTSQLFAAITAILAGVVTAVLAMRRCRSGCLSGEA